MSDETNQQYVERVNASVARMADDWRDFGRACADLLLPALRTVRQILPDGDTPVSLTTQAELERRYAKQRNNYHRRVRRHVH